MFKDIVSNKQTKANSNSAFLEFHMEAVRRFWHKQIVVWYMIAALTLTSYGGGTEATKSLIKWNSVVGCFTLVSQ